MPEMASWFEIEKGKFAFLTDDDVIAWHENQGMGTKYIEWNNFVGHGGLMKVFGLPDKYQHQEGFVGMPEIIKRHIFDGKMNKLFSAAENLREATPEFIPLMRRLANGSPKVDDALMRNPYNRYGGPALGNEVQMQISIDNGFQGSSIGNLLRDPSCNAKSMMLALTKAMNLMEEQSDKHHYDNIIEHVNVTPEVLEFIISNVGHSRIVEKAKKYLQNWKKPAAVKALKIKGKSVEIAKGNAKIRSLV